MKSKWNLIIPFPQYGGLLALMKHELATKYDTFSVFILFSLDLKKKILLEVYSLSITITYVSYVWGSARPASAGCVGVWEQSITRYLSCWLAQHYPSLIYFAEVGANDFIKRRLVIASIAFWIMIPEMNSMNDQLIGCYCCYHCYLCRQPHSIHPNLS